MSDQNDHPQARIIDLGSILMASARRPHPAEIDVPDHTAPAPGAAGHALMRHATREQIVRFMDRVETELLPRGEWAAAHRAMRALLKANAMVGEAALLRRASELLLRCVEEDVSSDRSVEAILRPLAERCVDEDLSTFSVVPQVIEAHPNLRRQQDALGRVIVAAQRERWACTETNRAWDVAWKLGDLAENILRAFWDAEKIEEEMAKRSGQSLPTTWPSDMADADDVDMVF